MKVGDFIIAIPECRVEGFIYQILKINTFSKLELFNINRNMPTSQYTDMDYNIHNFQLATPEEIAKSLVDRMKL